MIGELIILVRICAALGGEVECREVEVPTEIAVREECAAEAEAEANAALNLALLHSMRHVDVRVESVEARCAGWPM